MEEAKEYLVAYLNPLPPQYRDSAYLIAYYMAIPDSISIRKIHNFIANKIGVFTKDNEKFALSLIAVADFIQSNLCERIGYELYEMRQCVRDYFKALSISDVCVKRAIFVPNYDEVKSFLLSE